MQAIKSTKGASMCRWLAYTGRPLYLEDFLFKPENSLINQSLHARKAHTATNGDGFGVGWYGDRQEPGLFRDIRPAWNDENLRSIAEQIRTGHFFAHVRASTGTSISRANCHPFQHERWMFMHNGQIGGYGRIRRRVEALIDDRSPPLSMRRLDAGVVIVPEPCDDFRRRPPPSRPASGRR
jgi:glutamine amidotransferase